MRGVETEVSLSRDPERVSVFFSDSTGLVGILVWVVTASRTLKASSVDLELRNLMADVLKS